MIDIHDLYIGNWVYDGERTQFPMFIRAIGEDYVYLDFQGNEGDLFESTPEELQGIPLTEELMEKLGFTFKDGLWRHHLGIKVKPEAGFVFIENKDKEHWMYGNCTCKDIWHLHQLQNLVKLITKKELKIDIWR
jgi:hypothetical protein